MQAEEIIEIINGRIPFNKDTLSDIFGLIEEYPYFQTAHLLCALNLQANRDTRFPSRVSRAACYIVDRKRFFYWVEKDFFSSSLIESMEKKDSSVTNTPSDLIDFFLAEKKEKVRKEPSNTMDSQLVSTDYISYFLSKETLEQAQPESIPMQHQDTIDQFLSGNERHPIVIKLENIKEENEPDFNLEETPDDSFFSETLAKIYLKQKKYAKALEIIRKLNLVYPEKNIYFADQIRFLEKLIINAK
jgi:hypothetical protein